MSSYSSHWSAATILDMSRRGICQSRCTPPPASGPETQQPIIVECCSECTNKPRLRKVFRVRRGRRRRHDEIIETSNPFPRPGAFSPILLERFHFRPRRGSWRAELRFSLELLLQLTCKKTKRRGTRLRARVFSPLESHRNPPSPHPSCLCRFFA